MQSYIMRFQYERCTDVAWQFSHCCVTCAECGGPDIVHHLLCQVQTLLEEMPSVIVLLVIQQGGSACAMMQMLLPACQTIQGLH